MGAGAKLRVNIAMSLDGFTAGADQSLEDPLGIGGEQLHGWLVPLRAFRETHGETGGEVNASSAVVQGWFANVGAFVMGRNMFGGGPGPWPDEPWNGWWGDDPPYHAPVFVVTHHAREPLTLSDTTFHFVTDGVEAAVARAEDAAGGKDVVVGGGASVVQQCLRAGLLDEVQISLAPVLLHAGTRLFDGLADAGVQLEQLRAVEAPGVTHITYRVVR